MGTWGSRLKNQGVVFEVGDGFGPVVLDPVFPVVSHKIKSEAVDLLFHDAEQSVLKDHPLRGVECAFEDGILDALSVTFAGFGDSAEPPLSAFVLGIHIVADEYHHMRAYFQKTGG